MGDKSSNSQPAISLPKGGGAIKGIGETFQPNLFSGTGNFSVPIFTSPGRAGFGPQLTIQYSTGNGNGPFGLGWQLSIPRITRKTEKGLPKYTDEDVFVMSGAEDLVVSAQQPLPEHTPTGYQITRYRPRTEGLFARIEKWTKIDEPNKDEIHWRVTTKENVTSLYGKTEQARISKPMDPARIDGQGADQVYEWLLQETFDAKGNHILYEYVKENPAPGVQEIYEQNRDYSQTYLRRILYGNTPDDLDEEKRVGQVRQGTDHQNPIESRSRHYVFEVLFDYGDQLETPIIPYTHPVPQTVIPENWPVREDPFSTFRSGFEIRTLRRCRRVLMLHHFKEGELTGAPLVKSTDLTYENDPHTRLSILKSATITGYRKKADDGSYISSSMPPVEFGYSQFQPQKQHYQSLSARNNDLPPFSLKNPETTPVDLFGNGLPDILHTTSTGYYYWENLGSGRLDMRHPQHTVPAGLTLSQPGVAFADLGGDGLPDLIVVDESISGFFEATPDGGWKPFKRINYPSFGLNDPNVRLVDLTGDGRSDALMTLDHHFLWFECKGEAGYGVPQAVERIRDLDQFPDIYFNDPSGRVRLADMTGDGLNDIVLVHNGRIDYWPNLGYGHFGKRITMKNAPHLEHSFDPSRLFLADLDGSGCADLVYVDFGKVHFWLNQSGNGWSSEQVIHGTPYVTDLSSVQFADVFGTGTATLVWSYDFDFQPGGNYKALDFCGGIKPHLLIEMDNNMGATTRVQYAPSTKFYLENKQNGLGWATNLPFPVQVVEKVEAIDHIGKTKLVTTYKYHHGYYDGREREFRGFGRVDQFDTETFDDFTGPGLHDESDEFINNDRAFHVPPVETRTWFHTGIYFDEDLLIENGRFFDHQELMDRYRLEYSDQDQKAFRLAPHEFEGIGSEAPHEAYRALRGAVLRSEVFGRDDTDKQDFPYVVTENRYLVKQLQLKNMNHHGVYLTINKESLTCHYERNPEDPRIAHTINLNVDEYGNVTDSVAVGYPRRAPAFSDQGGLKAVYTKVNFINRDDQRDWYFIGIPCQMRRYEVGGLPWQNCLLRLEDFAEIRIESKDPFVNDNSLEFHEEEALHQAVSPCKRLIEWTRNYFRRDASAHSSDNERLELGGIERLGLPFESYSTVITQVLIGQLGDAHRVTDPMLSDAGYIKEPDTPEYWWASSGHQAFDSERFYQTNLFCDSFGKRSKIEYDSYSLMATKTTDPLYNIVLVQNDYRVLRPWQITDPNGNRSAVAFDALGLVAGTAVLGKKGENLGDLLEGLEPDLRPADLEAFLKDPYVNASDLLAKATTRIIYDLGCYRKGNGQPNYAVTLARETHYYDDPDGEDTRIQVCFSFFDGFGREIQKKVQAEPGPMPKRDENNEIVVGEDGQPVMTVDIGPRWLGSSWIIFNNKGKPVRQYEPFFSDTHYFDFNPRIGVSPTIFYDPLERVVCTLHPNRTYEKVIFDAWRQETWDVNDTLYPEFGKAVQEFTEGGRIWFDPSKDEHVGQFFSRLSTINYLPTWFRQRIDPELSRIRWPEVPGNEEATERNRMLRQVESVAASNALTHAATPAVAHLDVLGRPFLTEVDNGLDEEGQRERLKTRVQLDIQGNDRLITDPMGIEVFQNEVDMMKHKIVIQSADAGRKVVLFAVDEKPLCSLDANGNRVSVEYDALRRPTRTWVEPLSIAGKKIISEVVLYGEEMKALFGSANSSGPGNHRGRVFATLDGAGLSLNLAYDFKGNLLATSRRLAKDYGQDDEYSGLPEGASLALDWSPVRFSESLYNIENSLLDLLESETFISTFKFDALNRVVKATAPDHSQPVDLPPLAGLNWIEQLSLWLKDGAQTSPFSADGSVYHYLFNDAAFLQKVGLNIRAKRTESYPEGVFTYFVENIDYNVKGQRSLIKYGNGVKTIYEYCPETFRLMHLRSFKLELNETIQDLYYTYDPVGNITQIEDVAFPVVFNCNEKVCPTSRYQYDPTYRLIRAFGREHEAMTPELQTSSGKSESIFIRKEPQSINNGHALRNYIETYCYDCSGNIEKIRHVAKNGNWTRTQTYATSSNDMQYPGIPRSNRLLTSGTNVQTGSDIEHSHDSNGNMIHMPNKPELAWDHTDRLKRVKLDSGDNWAWYMYDSTGMRVRKVVKKNGTSDSERIYVGGVELWQDHGDLAKYRITLNVMDGQQRIALIEIEDSTDASKSRIRYQHPNHLGSSVIELDEYANKISYEEYYPYGGTAYLAGENWCEVESKRYRYSAKERDDETGFYYHGARYYSTWLTRWISVDPFWIKSPHRSSYAGMDDNPVVLADQDGRTTSAEYKILSQLDRENEEFLSGEVTWDELTERRKARAAVAGGAAASMLVILVAYKGVILLSPAYPAILLWAGNNPNKVTMAGDFIIAISDDNPAGSVPSLGGNSGRAARSALKTVAPVVADTARAAADTIRAAEKTQVLPKIFTQRNSFKGLQIIAEKIMEQYPIIKELREMKKSGNITIESITRILNKFSKESGIKWKTVPVGALEDSLNPAQFRNVDGLYELHISEHLFKPENLDELFTNVVHEICAWASGRLTGNIPFLRIMSFAEDIFEDYHVGRMLDDWVHTGELKFKGENFENL